MDLLQPGSLDQFEKKIGPKYMNLNSNKVSLAYKLLDTLQKDWLDHDLAKTNSGYSIFK